MDRNLFDKILKRFQELENNFPFIKNIESFKTTQGEFADGLNEDDIKMIGNTPVIIRGDADYNYTYYTAWNYFEDDDEYISSDTFFIKMEMDFSQEMHAFNRVLTIFISVVLFIAILTIFLINRRLIKKISAPFSYLAENMSKMGSHDLSTIDEKLERTDLKEVNMLLASYQEMTSELASSFEELKAVNDELEESYTETSILAENLHNVIQVATKLSDAVFDEKENFLVELFYVAEKLIPEADYGTVLLVENKQVKWLEAIGHNLEEIKKIPIKPDFFKAQDELIYIKDIDDEDTSIPYQGLMEELLENKRPIKSSLSVQLYVGDELAGLLNYDIAASSDDNFSRQSVETIKAFANLASAFLTIQSYKHIQEKFQREIILAIINILEIHDSYTKGHSENVARISALLAKEMGFSNEEVENIEWAGLVHDIGKILVSKDILNKPGALTVDEYKEIKKHTVWGYEVLVSSEELRDIAVSVRHHHERWDGDGYPDGLRGEQIPLFARIITLADAWDTMRSDRVYRKKLDKELAFKEVKDNIGKQFDPEVAKVAVRLIEEGKLS
ncbi:MAG: HD domain-containing phosphohydrolase [bacterium]